MSLNGFKLWSQVKPQAAAKIRPKLEAVKWDSLTPDDKRKIWQHFLSKGWFSANAISLETVQVLNDLAKKNSFGKHFLQHGGPHTKTKWDSFNNIEVELYEECCLAAASRDVEHIFHAEDGDVALEMLSLYALGLIRREDLGKDKDFDSFKKCVNDLFKQFGIDVVLTHSGFVPRQEPKLTDEVWEPVLSALQDEKWKDVNRDLKDAFDAFSKASPKGYSNSITYSIAALQAFFQILVHGKTGKGDLSDLIQEAGKKGLIKLDDVAAKLTKAIEAAVMEERQRSGDPHPKQNYANEKNALLVLNLVMVLLHFALQE